jgi:ABC-2 type transport system ATP-binding protein
MAEVAVRTEGLTKHFGGLTAVDTLDLSVGGGEIFGLIGSDGAGKTTTMRLLCGLLQADAGDIEVAGVDVQQDPEQARRRLGYLPQAFPLHGHLTIDENIDYFAHLFCQDLGEMGDRRAELLDATGLAEFTGRLAADLSGGMKQKAALICALIHRPEVLLLDEPTRGVDPVSRRDLWSIVYGLPAEGVTVVVATPDADEASRCGRVGIIAGGSLVEAGVPEEVVERHTGLVVELAVGDQRGARTALRAMDGVRTVSGLGDRLRVTLHAGGPDAETLAEALGRGGHDVGEAREVEPRLEDALLVLDAERGDDE